MRRSAWFTRISRGVPMEELPLVSQEGYDQEAADLAAAIGRLPDKYKEVILLYYFQEMTLSEVAKVVGVSPSMVSRRIKKAHVKLHGALGKEFLYE